MSGTRSQKRSKDATTVPDASTGISIKPTASATTGNSIISPAHSNTSRTCSSDSDRIIRVHGALGRRRVYTKPPKLYGDKNKWYRFTEEFSLFITAAPPPSSGANHSPVVELIAAAFMFFKCHMPQYTAELRQLSHRRSFII